MAMDHANDGELLTIANGNKQQQHTNQSTTHQPRLVVEEEEYQSTLSHIVTRDYFPSLSSLRRDAAILDARSRGDVAGAVAVRRTARREEMERDRQWREEMEAESEAVTETAIVPQHNISASNKVVNVRKRPRPLKHESITGFHTRVTSEDNAEFELNQERERKYREKHLGVVYASRADKGGRLLIEAALNNNGENNDNQNEPRTHHIARALMGCDTPIGLSSDLYDAPPSAGLRITGNDDDGTTTGDKMKPLGSNNGIGRNGLFFQPQHQSSAKMLTASGVPSGGTFLSLENGASTNNAETDNNKQGEKNAKCDNLLMPPPPSRFPGSSTLVPLQKSGEDSSTANGSTDNRGQLVEYLPKPALPDIHPPATRFPYQNESRLLAANNNSNSLIRSNNRRSLDSTASSYTDASDTTDLDASPPPLDKERSAHQRARLRENETYVAMTPLIQPGNGSGNRGGTNNAFEEDEPLMTWGDVGSTPLVLGGGAAVDGSNTSADWEPSRPASLAVQCESSAPAFDVANERNRETMARKAEKGLLDRGKSYRSAGTNVRNKHSGKDRDDESVRSSRSTSTAASSSSFDRSASLTPAGRALLEASTSALQSKKKSFRGKSSSSTSRIFQSSAPSSTSRPSSSSSRIHAGSKDSFGSALRMAYTPNATPRSIRKDDSRKSKSAASSPSSLMRKTAGGATPRCHSLR